MHSIGTKDDTSKRIRLLREVVELLMWELSAISNRKWEDLPELKKAQGNSCGQAPEIRLDAGSRKA